MFTRKESLDMNTFPYYFIADQFLTREPDVSTEVRFDQLNTLKLRTWQESFIHFLRGQLKGDFVRIAI